MSGRITMPIITENFLETPFGLFLDSRRVIEKGDVSFTGMGTIKGKFFIKDEEYPEFLDLLHDYLFEQNKRPLNLVEQRRGDLLTPTLIDLDFKYSAGQSLQRTFELSHIHAFIRKYVENITHFYNLENTQNLRFFYAQHHTKKRKQTPSIAPSKTAFILSALTLYYTLNTNKYYVIVPSNLEILLTPLRTLDILMLKKTSLMKRSPRKMDGSSMENLNLISHLIL
jgi:hypothetical protein